MEIAFVIPKHARLIPTAWILKYVQKANVTTYVELQNVKEAIFVYMVNAYHNQENVKMIQHVVLDKSVILKEFVKIYV
jgi:hypothetical protein